MPRSHAGAGLFRILVPPVGPEVLAHLKPGCLQEGRNENTQKPCSGKAGWESLFCYVGEKHPSGKLIQNGVETLPLLFDHDVKTRTSKGFGQQRGCAFYNQNPRSTLQEDLCKNNDQHTLAFLFVPQRERHNSTSPRK
jgi:hypothetical protein